MDVRTTILDQLSEVLRNQEVTRETQQQTIEAFLLLLSTLFLAQQRMDINQVEELADVLYVTMQQWQFLKGQESDGA